MADVPNFAEFDRAAIERECRAWAADERELEDDWCNALGVAIASRFEEWWSVIREVGLEPTSDPDLPKLSYVLGFAFERDRDLAARTAVDAQLSPRLANLVANGIEHAFGDSAANVLWRVEVLTEDLVVDGWLRNNAGDDGDSFWAWQVVSDLVQEVPDAAWRVLLRLVAASSTDEELGAIGAGPLEEFVSAYAAAFVLQIEEAAANNPRLRVALSGMWVWNDIDEDLFERIAAAAGSRLDAPSTQAEADERRASNAVHDAASSRFNELEERLADADFGPGELNDLVNEARILSESLFGDIDTDEEP